MKKYLLLLILAPALSIGQNLALSATASASASSSGNFGPANWNDGIFNGAFFGWVGTEASFPSPSFIEYEWTSAQWMDCVVVYNVGTNFQPPAGNAVVFNGTATLQYWDGMAWTNITNFNGQGSFGDSYALTFTPVQSTKLRIANFQTTAGNHNPGFDEIEVYQSTTTQNTYVDLAVTDLFFVIDTPAMEMEIFAEITNFGTQTAHGFDVSVIFNNSTPVLINYTDSLVPNQNRTYNLTATSTWDISNPMNYANLPLCVNVSHPLDTIPANNQMCDSLAFLSINLEPSKTLSTSIYPNPNAGSFHIELPLGVSALSITDALGRTVFQRNQVPEQTLLPVVLPHAKGGIYILHLHMQNKGVLHQKIIVR